MSYVLPIVAMLCTVFFTLTAVVFCAGMGANAKPHEVRALKQWMAGLGLLGVIGVAVSISLLRRELFGPAASVAIAPSGIILIIFIIALRRK